MTPSADPNPVEVLSHFPSLGRVAAPVAFGSRGGYSGALLWRVETAQGAVCLRAWPAEIDARRLDFIHELQARANDARLAFVPVLCRSTQQRAWVEHAGRLWEVATWLPGAADYRERPSAARLAAAAVALARLHRAWSAVACSEGVPPCVRRRVAVVEEWTNEIERGWRPLEFAGADDPVRPIAERAWAILPRRLARVPGLLESWSEFAQPQQPCHVDPWHDNLLFSGEELTGLVDYGAARLDHPAVDVARMLGTLAADDYFASWQAGLAAYRAIRPFSREDAALAGVLNVTGPAVALANWLLRLYRDFREFADRRAVAGRLEELVRRAASID